MSVNYKRNKANHKSRRWIIPAIIIALAIIASIAYLLLKHSPVTRNSAKLTFDSSLTSGEQQAIITAEKNLSDRIQGKIKVETVTTSNNPKLVLEAYVPVTSFNSARQSVSKKDLNELQIYVPDDIDPIIQKAITEELKLKPEKLEAKSIKPEDLTDRQVLLLPVDQLTSNVKMLGFEGSYYLDDTSKGAVFRQAVFSDNNTDKLVLNKLPTKASILTVNQTGVTAQAIVNWFATIQLIDLWLMRLSAYNHVSTVIYELLEGLCLIWNWFIACRELYVASVWVGIAL